MRFIYALLFLVSSLQASSQTFHHRFLRQHSSPNGTPYNSTLSAPGNVVFNGVSFVSPTVTLTDGNKAAPWNPLYGVYYPSQFLYQLDGLYNIDKINIWDNNPGSTVKISSGLWIDSLQVDTTIVLNKGGLQSVNIKGKQCRLIVFDLPAGAGPTEIQVLGRNISLDVIPNITLRPSYTLEKFLGWNCNVFTPDSAMPGRTSRRHYDYNNKIMYDDSDFVFQPNKGQYFYMDDYYKANRDSSRTIYPLLYNAADVYKQSYLDAGHAWNVEYKPMYYGANPYSPKAFKQEGRAAFQMAARFGNKTWSNSILKINTTYNSPFGNVKKSGLGYLKYIEFDNEIDRWWKGDTNLSFQPLQYFNLLSARYDGHCGTLGPYVGVKQADTSMKLVMPHLADFNLDYIKMLTLYSKRLRPDKKMPVDAFAYHWYPATGGGQFSPVSIGIAPEMAYRFDEPGALGIKEIIGRKTDWILRYHPGKEIIYGESGYDCSKNSYYGVPLLTQAQAATAAFWQNSYDLQASLLVRLVVESHSTRKLDQMILYEAYDEINYKDVADNYSDVDNNPSDYYSKYYGGIGFATSGIVYGGYKYIVATPQTPLTLNTTTGVKVINLPANRPYYRWKIGTGPKDTLDIIDETDNHQRFKAILLSQTDSTLTVNIIHTEGTATNTLSSVMIQMPFARKPSWYAFNNFLGVAGNCFLVADSSKNGYRDYVYRNAANTKEVRIVWKPTQSGSQINGVQINYPNTNPVTQKQFLSVTGATNSISSTGGHFNININEQPKIFYYQINGVPSNSAPVANAGGSKTVYSTSTTLSGSGTDIDGTIASYAWAKQSGGAATLSGNTSSTLGLSGLANGTYVFRLTVTDNSGATAFNDATLTISLPPTIGNQTTINHSGTGTVDFYDNGSSAFSPKTLTGYLWSQISGPNSPSIANSTTLHATVTGMINGAYVFSERITDSDGLTTTITFPVNISGVSSGNASPTANAGADQTTVSTTATISGSGTDSDGTIASYSWSKISGPNLPTMTGTTTATLGLSGLASGTYTFRLTVTDNLGSTGVDDVNIVVGSSGGLTTATWTSAFVPITLSGATRSVMCHIYRPVGYGNGSTFPLIVFVHGQGEKYQSTQTVSQNLALLQTAGLPKYLSTGGGSIPFVVVCPQIDYPSFDTYDNSVQEPGVLTNSIAGYMISNYDIDPQRCHLTGLSYGGQTICPSAKYFPNRWATCVPISTAPYGYPDADFCRAVFWWFHGAADGTYVAPANEVAWIDQLNSHGVIPFTSHYTIFAGQGHSSTVWDNVYAGTTSGLTLSTGSSVPNNYPAGNIYTFMAQYKIVSGTVQLVGP